jgi:hypothetical protein
MNKTARAAMDRIADRVDLAIDAVTLGQYGLEQAPQAPGCEGTARGVAQRAARRRADCDAQYSWDWPRSACRAG